jgi:uncharacterized membrane protein YeaQ/YmgE (transglycosylase-associated protein family)
MSVIEFFLLLLIAGISGSIGRSLTGYSKGGCFISIVVGFIGALIGTWLAHKTELDNFLVLNIGGVSFPVLWAIIGAVLFTGVLNLLTPRKKG